MSKIGEYTNDEIRENTVIFRVTDGRQREDLYINPLINYYPVLALPTLIIQHHGRMFDLVTDQTLSKVFNTSSTHGKSENLIIHNNVNTTSVEFYQTKIGFIERWVLQRPLLISNSIANQNGWVLVLLDPINILPGGRSHRMEQRGRYLPQDIRQLLVNAQVVPLTDIVNYV